MMIIGHAAGQALTSDGSVCFAFKMEHLLLMHT